MKQQPLAFAFAAAGLFLSLAPCLAEEAAETAKPNVLFLICDDLNCDLGCYGHPLVRSPNIDRLAAGGLRFKRAYCQFPLCGPSRASFMAGLYPDQTLIHRNAIRIRERLPEVETLSQMFRHNGYKATRVGKIYHYNVPRDIGTDGHGDPASWDVRINPRGRDKDDEPLIFSLRPGSFGGTLSWLAADGEDAEQTDGIAAREAIKVLESHVASQEPFFLAVGLYRPHTPYVAPKKYFEQYPLAEIHVPTTPANYHATLPASAVRTLTRKKDQINLQEELAKQAMQAYYASITFADAQLGHILDALDRLKLADNTIVLFTSDHGYHMGEHGYWQKTTLFENATHVPLIIRTPGMKTAGQATAAPVEMIDFYPTLAELCGLTPPANLSGVSLNPVLKNAASMPRRSALSQYSDGYSIRTPRYRYTEWGPAGLGGNELYDHAADPAEMVNLSGRTEHVQTVRELSQHLQQRIASAQQPPPGLKRIAPAKRPVRRKKKK